MSEVRAPLRKNIDITGMLRDLDRLDDTTFWRDLVPGARLSDDPLRSLASDPHPVTPVMIDGWKGQLRDEGYFQTGPMVGERRRAEMLRCIEGVRARGLPATFAVVYDVFLEVFGDLHAMFQGMLGARYGIIPNVWIYYIEQSEHDHGFQPHRDAEYADTINGDGMPTVLTLWLAINDATSLNSCIYVVPRQHDPGYAAAIHSLDQEPPEIELADIRALPVAAGSVLCWDQYVYHWGSRSCHRALAPRVSFTVYCQRGDVEPVDSALVPVPSPVPFDARLAYACRGVHRYSYLALRERPESRPVLDFLTERMTRLGRRPG